MADTHNTTTRDQLFDDPLWRDWTLWLALFGVLAGIVSVSGTSGGALDYTFAVAFQFALFGLLPATIRRAIRRRRA